MALQAVLPSLTVREAITDAIYRAVLGLDTADPDLFDSAFTQDAEFEINGRVMHGLQKIHTECYDPIAKLDTTHFITNVRINFKDGENKASMVTHALAQHYRHQQGLEPNAVPLLSGGLYFLDLVKDETDGLWKMTKWKLQSTWAEGDWGVMRGE